MSEELSRQTIVDAAFPEGAAAPAGTLEDGVEVLFPEGLVGCASWNRFVLRSTDEQAPIQTLECLDDSNVSLFILDPNIVVEDYIIEMPESDQRAIELESASDASVFVILVLRHDPLVVTANLLGPLVINSRTKLGCQLVLENTEYSVRHLVYSETPEEGGKEDAA